MSSTEPIDPNVDPYGYVGLVENPDGTIARKLGFIIPTTPANPDPSGPDPVLTKDVFINKKKGTFARLYLSRPVLKESVETKLPLIIYYHGGGFVMAVSPASTANQNICSSLTHQIPSVLVSVGYRLAPEHRLPAAYDDCMEALHWVRGTNDEWLTNYADLSKCFLIGTSAGGNIPYHVGLRAAACVDQLMPLKIQGLILHHPFFGGVERTPSEIRLVRDKFLPLIVTDIFWDLALPIGADRDHEYSNPIMHVQAEIVDKMKDEGWRFLVTGCHGDPLVDRQIEVAKMLRERGVDVVEMFDDGGYHAIEISEEAKASKLYDVIKNFILDF